MRVRVLIRRQAFEQCGERQLFEYSRDSEADAYYIPFLPKFRIKNLNE